MREPQQAPRALPSAEPSKTGLVRLSSILAPVGPIPVSKSTWWAGVKSQRYPQPVRLGPNTTAWRWSEIQELIDGGSSK